MRTLWWSLPVFHLCLDHSYSWSPSVPHHSPPRPAPPRPVGPTASSLPTASLPSHGRRHSHGIPRRSVVALVLTAPFLRVSPTHAAMTARDTPFTPGARLPKDQAIQRFQQGRDSLRYLIDHFDEVQQGGGDNVRRYLGTVGTTSGLYGISKVMRSLQDEAEVDLVEFAEAMTEIEQSIQQADGSAYMAIFVTTSTSGVPPEKYFKDALTEAKRAAKSMEEMAAMLGLDDRGGQ